MKHSPDSSYSNHLKEVFTIILLLLVLCLLMSGVLMGVFTYVEYINYSYYDDEGYRARWSFGDGCEIKIKNLDGFSSWEDCDSIGNNFVLENHAVKTGDSK